MRTRWSYGCEGACAVAPSTMNQPPWASVQRSCPLSPVQGNLPERVVPTTRVGSGPRDWKRSGARAPASGLDCGLAPPSQGTSPWQGLLTYICVPNRFISLLECRRIGRFTEARWQVSRRSSSSTSLVCPLF